MNNKTFRTSRSQNDKNRIGIALIGMLRMNKPLAE